MTVVLWTKWSATRAGPVQVTSKQELFRARSLLRGSLLLDVSGTLISEKPVSREFAAPLVRDADYASTWIASEWARVDVPCEFRKLPDCPPADLIRYPVTENRPWMLMPIVKALSRSGEPRATLYLNGVTVSTYFAQTITAISVGRHTPEKPASGKSSRERHSAS